jgi:uncharacterized protein (DUF362 family)
MRRVKVVVLHAHNNIDEAVQKALKAADWSKHIRGRVFIKPNICSCEFISGAVTNPELLFYLVSFLRDKVTEVIVGESNGYNYNCDDALQRTGIEEAVKKAGGVIVNLSKDEIVRVEDPYVRKLRKVPLPKTLLEIDSLVSVPVMKTHEFTLYGGAIKNLFGCIPDNRRIFLHPHIGEVFQDLITILKPKFALMDATTAMEGNGPNRGIAVPMNLVLASSDLLALDKVTTQIMGIDWRQVSHLRQLDKYLQTGLEPQIIGEDIDSVKRPFLMPYADLAVKAQRWVFKYTLLTRLCFGTPLFNALQVGMKGFRAVNDSIRGKAWVRKYWQDSSKPS